jgi:flagellin
MRSGALGVEGIDITNQSDSNQAIETINNALETVSGERAKFGAMQNRLEHTINNLRVAEENLQAAESRIRDTDMASEMVNLNKDRIITQSGTAMLAQANVTPQNVLQLLR